MTLPNLSPSKFMTTATGPNNELIVVQGGIRGRRWDGDEERDFLALGVDAPTTAPTVIADPTAPTGYYVARVDVTKGGHCYSSPPALTFSTSPAITSVAGGVAAKAISYLNQSSVADVRVTQSGKYYPSAPTVSLSSTCGSGAVLTAVLDIPDGAGYDATNDPMTGITQWEIIQAPSYLDESGETADPLIWYKAFNGTSHIYATNGTALSKPFSTWQLPTGTNWDSAVNCTVAGASPSTLVVTGDTHTGQPAKIKLVFSGARWTCSVSGATANYTYWRGARAILAATPGKYGSGYDPNTVVVVRIRANQATTNTENDIVIYGYPTGNDNNTQARGYPIKSITIDNPGSGYVVAPEIQITSKSGFGAVATCTVTNGQITGVTLVNNGAGYKTPPTVTAVSGGAEVFPVARPHLRGKYLCYYRYIDDTASALGGPFPSCLSPVAEFDAGNGVSRIRWTCTFPTGDQRGKAIELWRTTSNQAMTLYRVSTQSSEAGYYTDDLTDDELRDPGRAGYAAMPILLPNGELCANRFVPPPEDKDVVVRYQDRYWYGVDTSGSELNTIYYSEVDEPESVPDINQIVLQQSGKDSDSITALAPANGAMFIFQERHAYALTFASNPALDAQVHQVAFRGALNQRCWDIYDGVLYVLDQVGVYAVDPAGGVQDLSAPIANLIDSELDLLNAGRNFLAVDQATMTLRAFVSFKSDSGDGFATRALCYSLRTKSWYMEKYPQKIRTATNGKIALASGAFAPSEVRTLYAGESGVMLLNEGYTDIARGAVLTAKVTERGSGYKTPPTVTASGGVGAEFQAVINSSGQVTAIYVKNPGRNYGGGSLIISAPNDPSAGVSTQAAGSYTASSASVDTSMFVPYRLKTGCAAYVDDSENPKAAGVSPRQVRVAYKPQSVNCPMAMRLFYNNAKSPRPNIATRVRGAGFSFSSVDGSARIDLGRNTIKGGADDGVASAQLSGKTIDDLNGTDRNIAIEITGARTGPDPVIIYGVEASGTAGG